MEKRKNICVVFVVAVFISFGYSVNAFPSVTEGSNAVRQKSNSTTNAPITVTPTAAPNTTTIAPSTTTTTAPPNTTTVAPTTVNPTSTVSPTTPTTIIPTTRVPPQPKPDRSFDLPSFVGGIILALGVLAIGYVVYKFYRARTDPNYRTL